MCGMCFRLFGGRDAFLLCVCARVHSRACVCLLSVKAYTHVRVCVYCMCTRTLTCVCTQAFTCALQNGAIAALPYLASWVCMIVSGYVADLLISRQLLSTTKVRKLAIIIGAWRRSVRVCLEVLEGVLGGCGGFRGCAWRLWGF